MHIVRYANKSSNHYMHMHTYACMCVVVCLCESVCLYDCMYVFVVVRTTSLRATPVGLDPRT